MLARNLEKLREEYKLGEIQSVDIFSRIAHVETVALLSKLDVDKYINIETKLDELD